MSVDAVLGRERRIHATDVLVFKPSPSALLRLRDNSALQSVLHGPLLERAIGVTYRLDTERMSDYFGPTWRSNSMR